MSDWKAACRRTVVCLALAPAVWLAAEQPARAQAASRGDAIILAQGSAGGTIGKRGKSAAGEEAAPQRRAAPRRERRTTKRPVERRRQAPRAVSAAPARPGCARAIGSWLWFNSATVVIKPGGVVTTGPIQASWQCEGDVIVITGPLWIDRMTLSADGNTLSGTNALGLAVSGKRL
jgi:hypothetical protein